MHPKKTGFTDSPVAPSRYGRERHLPKDLPHRKTPKFYRPYVPCILMIRQRIMSPVPTGSCCCTASRINLRTCMYIHIVVVYARYRFIYGPTYILSQDTNSVVHTNPTASLGSTHGVQSTGSIPCNHGMVLLEGSFGWHNAHPLIQAQPISPSV
jgi:hypothetical protein